MAKDFNNQTISIGNTVAYAYKGTSLAQGRITNILTDNFKRSIVVIATEGEYQPTTKRLAQNVIVLNEKGTANGTR